MKKKLNSIQQKEYYLILSLTTLSLKNINLENGWKSVALLIVPSEPVA